MSRKLDTILNRLSFIPQSCSDLQYLGSSITRQILETPGGKRFVMNLMFDRNDENTGWLVYKTFGGTHCPPAHWNIEPGSTITEVSNRDPMEECGAGINVGTFQWVDGCYDVTKSNEVDIYELLIRDWDLRGVTIPYYTEGKIRCERATILDVYQEYYEHDCYDDVPQSECPECGDTFCDDDGYWIGNNLYCPDCVSICEECGEDVLTKDTVYVDFKLVCTKCAATLADQPQPDPIPVLEGQSVLPVAIPYPNPA